VKERLGLGLVVAAGRLGALAKPVERTERTIIDQTVQNVMWVVALSIAMVLLFMAFFSIEMGPVTWVYTSEIFPLPRA
jgi:hypothetical protein